MMMDFENLTLGQLSFHSLQTLVRKRWFLFLQQYERNKVYVKAGSNTGVICNDHVLPLAVEKFYNLTNLLQLVNCMRVWFTKYCVHH